MPDRKFESSGPTLFSVRHIRELSRVICQARLVSGVWKWSAMSLPVSGRIISLELSYGRPLAA